MASFHRDALTLSAEVFAVVGVADVVLRQLIALTNLATAAANASRTAREMRTRLQNLASAILTVRTWAESYAGSDFATEDNQRISATVTEILLQCSARLGAMFKNLHNVESGASGTLARFWTGLRFARNEQAHHQAMTDLLSYTSALQLAMHSRHGTDLTIIRQQQRLYARTAAENYNVINAGVDAILHTTSAHAKTAQSNHNSTLARIDDLRLNQAATHATLQACTEAIMTTLQLTHLDEDKVLVEGNNLRAGVEALQYLNKHLSHSLTGLGESENGLVLPTSLAVSLTGEVDQMIKYSQRYVRARTDIFLARSDCRIPRRIQTMSIRTHSGAEYDDGVIVIESVEGEDALGRRVQYIRFLALSTKAPSNGSAILGLISRIDLGTSQQIRRQLRVVNILPEDSLVFRLAKADDVEGIKKLLVEGKASVLDYTKHGLGLLWFASQSHSWATLHLLLDLGVDTSSTHYYFDNWVMSIGYSLGMGILIRRLRHVDPQQLSAPDTKVVSDFKLCWDFLQIAKAEAAGTDLSTGLLFICLNRPHPEDAKLKGKLFPILWDGGLGRRYILGLLHEPFDHKLPMVAAIIAWARAGALRENPGISDVNGRTVLHLLLLVVLENNPFRERLAPLLENFATDWKRICQATYYAFIFRRSYSPARRELRKLLRLLLRLGVNPLQKDNEGVSAWDVVQKSADEKEKRGFAGIFEPFVS